jgi:hypothetical protein
MKRSLAISLALGVLAPVTIGTAVSWGASSGSDCWDEYNTRGTRLYRTVAPKGSDLDDCDPGPGCFWGYSATKGTVNRLYVPHGADPKTACDEAPSTTAPPDTLPDTTLPPDTTVPPIPGQRFGLLGVGAELPSGADCAARVRPMKENRPENATYNATPGTSSNGRYPRVTGDFTGSTDEIIQWTACKWGIDEDFVRAQINNESSWKQTAIGDFTTSPEACAPGFPIGNYPPQWNGDSDHAGECPESVGLGQVRWLYHSEAFDQDNAVKSSAYNLDYTYAVWRQCFEGNLEWLNTVEGRGDYAAGDAIGCLGVWFSGRWYTDAAQGYIARFNDTLSQRVWEQPWFPPAESGTGPTDTTVPPATIPETSAPTTTAPETTVATTTAPDTTVPATTAPPTTAPATIVPDPVPTGVQFMETFDNNTGMENLDRHVFHRNPDVHNYTGWSSGTWTGDHDLDCGGPDTQRPLQKEPNDGQATRIANSFYTCRNHMMTAMGDVDGYSIVAFSPKQTFPSVSQVCVDVNLTDLGNRQWLKFGVVSESLYNSANGQVPGYIVSDVLAADVATDLATSDRLIASWSGGLSGGAGGGMKIGNTNTNSYFSGGFDKATRYPVCLTDNGNGTVTFDVASASATTAGSFPDGPVRVVFYDHSYTPDKSNGEGWPVIGYTFHWDNIVVK